MAKSTYYFELSRVSLVESRNKDFKDEIKKIFEQNKDRFG